MDGSRCSTITGRMKDNLTHLTRSLRQRSYRTFYVGHCITVFGVWMQQVAQAWLVYRLTQSSFMLGLASFAGLVPVLVFGLVGGGLADRFSPHRLLIISSMLALVQSLVLASLTLSGTVSVWQILVLALVLGLSQAVQIPARHTFVAQIVPREDLHNAIGLNSSAFNAARFVSPAVAGALVYLSNEGIVFLINGLCFLVYLYLMLTIIPAAASRPRRPTPIRDGLLHAWRDTRIRAALAMAGLVSLVGTAYIVLMPVFAKEVFGGGPGTLGTLMSAAGGGSLMGALSLANRKSPAGLDRLTGYVGILGGISLVLFCQTSDLAMALAVLVVVGFAVSTVAVASHTLIQLVVPDQLRGRVSSVFSVVFLGLTPLGSLIVGAIAELAGVATTVTGCGILFCAGAALSLRRCRKAGPKGRGGNDAGGFRSGGGTSNDNRS
jgi:MFS family permease